MLGYSGVGVIYIAIQSLGDDVNIDQNVMIGGLRKNLKYLLLVITFT